MHFLVTSISGRPGNEIYPRKDPGRSGQERSTLVRPFGRACAATRGDLRVCNATDEGRGSPAVKKSRFAILLRETSRRLGMRETLLLRGDLLEGQRDGFCHVIYERSSGIANCGSPLCVSITAIRPWQCASAGSARAAFAARLAHEVRGRTGFWPRTSTAGSQGTIPSRARSSVLAGVDPACCALCELPNRAASCRTSIRRARRQILEPQTSCTNQPPAASGQRDAIASRCHKHLSKAIRRRS
jgi:hypothetical protein